MVYRPLSFRTTFVMITVSFAVLTAFASDFVGLATAGDESDETLLLNGGLGLFQFGAAVLAAIAVCVWMYRAAANLRAFGNPYLNYTPGWSVGWWFVPFANLVKPFQAMSEIVNASDPGNLGGDGYPAPPPTGLLGGWWAAWITSNVVANVSMRIDDAGVSASISLISSVAWAVAAGLLFVIVRRVDASQAECDRRLMQNASNVPAAPYRGRQPPWGPV